MTKNNIRYKSLDITEHKQDGDRLIIEAYGAVFGNIDSYGDVIRKGAFTKTLQEQAGRIAFCFQHDINHAIGKILDISEDDHGLKLTVEMSSVEKGISTKIREGIYKELSIGYKTINAELGVQDGMDVMYLTEIKLYEVSIVTIAANPEAFVMGMKSEEERRDYVEKSFDRIITLNKNRNLEFELLNLKALVEESLKHIEPTKEPQQEDDSIYDELRQILL